MTNDPLSPHESLRLITTMIEKTKENISVNSHYFLLWGWAGFVAFIAQYILKTQLNYEKHYMVWLVTFVCLAIMIVWLKRDRRQQQTTTYVGESMSHLWFGVGIAFSVISIILVKVGYQHCYPFFIMLYGLGTFISGRLLKFTPLIVGGILNFIIAAIAPWIDYDYQILLGAAAILTSYIIPGHMLRAKYKVQKVQNVQGVQ